MGDNLDDYDFTPSSSSNLRSLFDNSTDSSESSSLTYTAPKQPKLLAGTNQRTEPTKMETSVIFACVVQVWKLTDGKYIAIGKYGCAVIGSSTQTSYEMILYKEKQNVIMRSKISPNFEFSLKKDDFASFYDSVKSNWLIKFVNNDDFKSLVSYIEEYGGRVISTENSISTPEKPEDVKTSEELNPDNKVKADILTRIAKMGQPILPNKGLEAEVCDTKDTSESYVSKNEENSSTSLVATTTSIIQSVPNTFMMSQPISYDPFNIYVAENRTHSSEVRMNLSQISDKLNCIMKLVESPKVNTESDCAVLKSKIKVLELRSENLLRELSSLREENAKLNLEMKDQNDILSNEELFKTELKQLQEKIMESEIKIAALKQEKSENTEAHNVELEKLKKELKSAQDETKWTSEIKRLENEINSLQEKLIRCEAQQQHVMQPSAEISKEKGAKFTSMLKEEMNSLFGSLGSNLEENQVNVSEVRSAIAQNIKFTTLKIIQNFQQLYENQEQNK